MTQGFLQLCTVPRYLPMYLGRSSACICNLVHIEQWSSINTSYTADMILRLVLQEALRDCGIFTFPPLLKARHLASAPPDLLNHAYTPYVPMYVRIIPASLCGLILTVYQGSFERPDNRIIKGHCRPLTGILAQFHAETYRRMMLRHRG